MSSIRLLTLTLPLAVFFLIACTPTSQHDEPMMPPPTDSIPTVSAPTHRMENGTIMTGTSMDDISDVHTSKH